MRNTVDYRDELLDWLREKPDHVTEYLNASLDEGGMPEFAGHSRPGVDRRTHRPAPHAHQHGGIRTDLCGVRELSRGQCVVPSLAFVRV